MEALTPVWSYIIQGVVTLLLVVVAGAIVKVLVGRTFKSIDQDIKKLSDQVVAANWVPRETFDIRMQNLTDAEASIEGLGKDVVRLEEITKILAELRHAIANIDTLRAEFLEKFQRKTDFIRELSLLVSQIEGIYKKIDHIDDKIDKLRDMRKGANS